ncbi:HdeD family acid-resistance protein [Stakelama marina]|uniref:HdeD family acid-resistance protein n=1 Tax=Stakelama marina TaxID=2826939 RepID=A0A8T4IE11_9SPHN|nr:HdeD family acid-resistance protein [Stakelama marina]MBR0551235.1 HdeD family acid-resistance protein [Stakelama marina]
MTDTHFSDDHSDGVIPPVLDNRGWGWMLAFGLLSIIIGIVSIFWPFPASLAAALVTGSLLFVAGVGALVSAFSGHNHESRTYTILLGILSVIVGLLIWFAPVAGVVSLAVLVMVWLASRGVMELYLGFRYRRNRGLMVTLGIINLLLVAAIVLTVPLSALVLPGYILGLSFLFGGFTQVAHALSHKRAA